MKALIGLHGEMEPKFVKNRKKQSKIFSLSMCFNSCSLKFLKQKKKLDLD